MTASAEQWGKLFDRSTPYAELPLAVARLVEFFVDQAEERLVELHVPQACHPRLLADARRIYQEQCERLVEAAWTRLQQVQ
jgi:hypothetical protein